MPVNVLILCAGHGTRLSPLTDTLPKALLPLSESETILVRLIRQFQSFVPIPNIWVNISAHSQVFLEYLSTLSKQARPKILLEPQLLGAANTIFEISKFIDGPLLVVHGDLVLSKEYVIELVQEIETVPRFYVVCHFRSQDRARSQITTQDSNCVIEFKNSRDLKVDHSPVLVNSGIYFFPDINDIGVRPGFGTEIADSILQYLIARKKLYALKLELKRLSVDSHKQLQEAKKMVINERLAQGGFQIQTN